MTAQRGDGTRHNHVTRDVKPRGVCPACDRILDKAAETLPVPCAMCGGDDHREWSH